ncbi:hypothetical protein DRN74_02420 [Candidatus Micrarchaeota archaeon]|mgnify:CR=1 FL=1|nr:MAG: hypothetical protein DRN74_02420 [Candidatus Micrarchaeota archaeon]
MNPIDIVVFLVGLGMLIFGSDTIVKAVKRFAERAGMSELLIGLTVVSIGTSLPEIATSLNAGFHNMLGIEASGIAIGNAIGSNIVNLTLTLGIAGLFGVLALKERDWYRDCGTMLAVIAMLYVFAVDNFISPLEGFVLIGMYFTYAQHILKGIEKHDLFIRLRKEDIRDIIIGFIGVLLLIYGANLVVESGIRISNALKLDEVIIGLLIGLGTALPELTVSITAILRRINRLSVGTLIGSNILNPTLVLGLGAVVAGFKVENLTLSFDLPVLFVITGLVAVLFGLHEKLRKKSALLLILIYIMFMTTRVLM